MYVCRDIIFSLQVLFVLEFLFLLLTQEVQTLFKGVTCSPVRIFGCRPGVKLEENYTHGCNGGGGWEVELMTKLHSVDFCLQI